MLKYDHIFYIYRYMRQVSLFRFYLSPFLNVTHSFEHIPLLNTLKYPLFQLNHELFDKVYLYTIPLLNFLIITS